MATPLQTTETPSAQSSSTTRARVSRGSLRCAAIAFRVSLRRGSPERALCGAYRAACRMPPARQQPWRAPRRSRASRRSRLAGRRFRFRHAMTHLRVIHLRMVHLRLIRNCRRRLRVVHPGVIHPGVIHLRMIHLRLIGRRRCRHRVAHLRVIHFRVLDLLRECRCGCDQGKRKECRLHAMPSPTCTVRIIPASMWYSR